MTRDRPCKARKVKCGEERPQCVKYNDLAFLFPYCPGYTGRLRNNGLHSQDRDEGNSHCPLAITRPKLRFSRESCDASLLAMDSQGSVQMCCSLL